MLIGSKRWYPCSKETHASLKITKLYPWRNIIITVRLTTSSPPKFLSPYPVAIHL